MKIRIETHALERAVERGATPQEIEEVVRTGQLTAAKFGRLAKSKVYEFDALWKGRFFEQKRVEVIYAVERGVIIVVTVYVFYGWWTG